MKFKIIFLVFLFGMLVSSCKQQSNSEQTTQSESGKSALFPKGERITNENFSGTAWLENLVLADSVNQNAVGSVTFEPGARTNWHSHPAGQIIISIAGKGYYQEEGSAKRIIQRGDVVKCPPDVPHWHGASADEVFVQIAITSRENGPTKWLKPVTEEEYGGMQLIYDAGLKMA